MWENGVLGIDVGGTGIKGAIVDVSTGELLTEKRKIATPKPATPEAVLSVITQMVEEFNYKGVIGCGFPSVLKNGVVCTATNLDPSWIGVKLDDFISNHLNVPVSVINDADVAALGEGRFGAARDINGLVIMVTLGTGVGSGMLLNGELIHNTELGFLPMRGGIAELRISNTARKKYHLSWIAWGKRLQDYLKLLDQLFHPNMIILGGGICKQFDKFDGFTKLDIPVVPAELQNNAGCVGAALYAYHTLT